ncbi:hypothetical protein [Flavobacterium sp. 102]|uniref:hypothetical protein n=1 Tax=Flavobacterium sp. 102 TaxID=2135623 RepID=UPI000EACA30B|nr:hypothetical protein [Flavobacterium sp. 102]RKS03321.1 hypothetical protein C8C84_3075 [Flavobacterium sp. 102]
MKSTIIFLGLAVLGFNNNSTANELNIQDLVQQDLATVSVDNAQQNQLVFANKEILKVTFDNTGEEASIFNPTSVIKSTYSKTLNQVIAENNLVIDNCEDSYQPISLEMSAEDIIAERNQIVESSVDREYYPLDFERINRSLKNNKPSTNNMAVTVDLKL